MDINQAIKAVVARENLNEHDMHDVMNSIMTGQTTDAQIGAFLVGLSMNCLLYTSPSPRDATLSRMPSSA